MSSAVAHRPEDVDLFDPNREVNIAWYIPELARRVPHQRAIVMPGARDARGRRSYTHLTFEQLDEECNRYARGLMKLGIQRGTKTMLMVKPSLEFFALAFALFKVGAIPVMIDPGLGRRGFLDAVKEVRPTAFIGISIAHVLRTIFRGSFSSIETNVTVGRRLWWGGATLEDIRHEDASALDLAPTKAGELAAILFTSGSTGPAKGVEYSHGVFDAQTRLIRSEWGIEEGEVDLPAFPLFALFSCALGATCVIPDMDATRPARADGALMVEAIRDHGVTYSFGSPAFWRSVGGYCLQNDIQLPTLRRIIMAGAPVPPKLIEDFRRILTDGDIHIPYGATEALPVSKTRGRELLAGPSRAMSEGAGSCVGRPLSVNEVRIIRIRDDEIPTMAEAEVLSAGEIGEIIVRGPTVTHAYFERADATAKSKIRDGDAIWHRMGDVGYLDEEGRIWFCGRKSHRVETERGPMYSVCCEGIFNAHPRVYRSALVGLGASGQQRPVIVIECERGAGPESKTDEATLRAELLDLAKASPLTDSIRDLLFHPAFPVDVRHNAKIRRELLAEWARSKVGP